MSLTYGFYDSINGDRKYNAQEMSAIFDGVINDGVFDSVGDIFAVSPAGGMNVKVGSGRAWFDHTWTYNDADYPLIVDAAEVALTRIDAVVLETDATQSVRANRLKVIRGTPAATPEKPTLSATQHPLAYVTVTAGTTEIDASMIENVVGQSPTPFVTAILETTDITALMARWEAQFDQWFAHLKSELSSNQASNLQRQIDDVVDALYQHVWTRRAKPVWTEHQTATTSPLYLSSRTSTSASTTWQYSDAITIDDNGAVSLVNSSTISVSYSTYGTVSTTLQGKYIMPNGGGLVYFVPATATLTRGQDDNDYYYTEYATGTIYVVTAEDVASDATAFVYSDDAATYPMDGVQGDYYYRYWGIAYDNAIFAGRVVYGTYQGTGVYGSTAPNVLTFSCSPKIVFVYVSQYYAVNNAISNGSNSWGNTLQIFFKGGTIFESYGPSAAGATHYTLDGDTLTWYSGRFSSGYGKASAEGQMNTGGNTYHYIAIG